MKYILFTLLLLSCIAAGCKDETAPGPSVIKAAKGIYVINEGSFSQNNSSVTYYNLATNNTILDAYNSANNTSLGDNANSIFIHGSKGYIAVDNSNKIEIIDLNNFKSLGQIDFGISGSPREIFIKDSLTGYATSLYKNEVVKFNPSTKQIIKKIAVGNYPDGLIEANGKLFVANSGFGASNSVSVIDMGSDAVIKTLNVGFNPRVIIKQNNTVYVVCTGSYTDTTVFSGVYSINPISAEVIDSVKVRKNPGEASAFEGSSLLVVNSDGLMKVNFADKSVQQVVSASSINSLTSVIYSVTYDPAAEKIYAGNPKDFQQNGEVVVMDKTGKEQKRFSTGINPGTISIRY